MSEELKPCPFCGQMPLYWQAKMYGGERAPSFIRCRRCNFYVSKMGPDSDEQVFDIWNARPVEDALRSRAEKAEGAASEQSEMVQRDWLSPIEAAGLRVRAERAEADAARLAEALRNLNHRCWLADIDGDLSGWIDGTLLTDADAALVEHDAQKEVKHERV